jgi:hypothetical protein
MSSSGTDEDPTPKRRTKVARLIDEYELAEIGDEMERRWTKTGDEHTSLRDLADYFNTRLLTEAIDDAGGKTLPGEVDHLYDMLTGNDVSDADQTRIKRSLERDGVDVEELLEKFVTHQAVHTYLKRDRDAEYTTDDVDRITNTREHVQRLRGRMTSVIEGQLNQLRNSGNLTLGNFKVFIDIGVFCEDCGTQIKISGLLERGGCDCGSAD